MVDYSVNRGVPPDFESGQLSPPARWELLREVRIIFEILAAMVGIRRIIESAPRGQGELVMVLPGVATDDSWTARLRGFLTSIGYHAVGWGLGRNGGNVPKLIPKLVERTDRLAAGNGSPTRLIGWSLGGYLAREVARERPELVDSVITLGSPIVGGPSYTASASMYVRKGYNLEEIKASVLQREQRPIEVPVFAVYSRSDGVVAWRACVDNFSNPRVEHHEVSSSHLGLVNAPHVLRLVADLLARTNGES